MVRRLDRPVAELGCPVQLKQELGAGERPWSVIGGEQQPGNREEGGGWAVGGGGSRVGLELEAQHPYPKAMSA